MKIFQQRKFPDLRYLWRFVYERFCTYMYPTLYNEKKVSQYLYVFKVLYIYSYILNTGMFSVHVFHKGLGVCDQQEIYYRGTRAKHYLTLEMTSD